jgi:hypothetical protein
MARDKVDPNIIAAENVKDLETLLEQYRMITEDSGNSGAET